MADDQLIAAARAVFGDRFALAERYHDILAGRGVEWGLLGPREAGRIWGRHVLNSAALADLMPADAAVCDVGSGAGLPGSRWPWRGPTCRSRCWSRCCAASRFSARLWASWG